MDRFDRIFALHHLLSGRRSPMPLDHIMQELECSRATANRAIRALRNDFGAPIEYHRELNGYRYLPQASVYELPGLWLNASELIALIASERLLAEVEPGVLAPILEPLHERLQKLLRRRRLGINALLERIRIFKTDARAMDVECFRRTAEALGSHRRLKIRYHGRTRDKTTERIVSPQRLVYYRDNWYLDAWCHVNNGLRTFALDRLHALEMLDAPAREIADAELDAHFKGGYGIFAGSAKHTAVLRFAPHQARWVADECWHPEQRGNALTNGGYELLVPYADPRELIMQILKYGPDVEVIAPLVLRRAVAERIGRAAKLYAR